MNLIQITETPPRPAAEVIAETLLHKVNAALAQRVYEHQESYAQFWDNSESADSILAAMGTNAALFLMSASENIQHIGRLAGLVGKQVDDFIDPSMYVPRHELIINQDGSAMVKPPHLTP